MTMVFDMSQCDWYVKIQHDWFKKKKLWKSVKGASKD